MLDWDPTAELLDVRVRQSVGSISVQAGCDFDSALDLLIVEAAKLGQSLHDTALDVLDRVIVFDGSRPR